MTLPLALRHLDAVFAERGSSAYGSSAYVVTVSEAGTPHVVDAEVVREGDRLSATVGAHTADNASRQPRVSLLYPSRTAGDYSLIVDAVATVEKTAAGARLLLAPTRAVLHRSAPPPDPATSSCGSDCVPLAFGSFRPGGPA